MCLPYDWAEIFDDYMFYLSQLLQIIEDFSSPYVYICGDFKVNVLSHSRFVNELLCLYFDNSPCLSDTLFLPSNTCTFIISNHDTVSWLDHVLSTTSGHSHFNNMHVKSDCIASDHLTLSFSISIDNLHVGYLYRHVITLHEIHSVITGTEHPMLICIIIFYVLELNLPKSSCPLMLYSVTIYIVFLIVMILINFITI